MKPSIIISAVFLIFMGMAISLNTSAQTGVGAKCPKGAVVYFDGTPELLHKNWGILARAKVLG